MNKLINLLERRGLIWQGDHRKPVLTPLASGFSELDQALTGGFPKHSVVELESDLGVGELRILLNSYQLSLTESQEAGPKSDKLFVVIALPGVLNAEMLHSQEIPLDQVIQIIPANHQQALWSAEQCLKSGCCASVVLWHQQALTVTEVKRLQQACEQGMATQFLIRQPDHARKKDQIIISLPVALKLALSGHPKGLSAEVKKQKGGWPGKGFTISMEQHWPMLCHTASNKPSNLVPFPRSKHA